MDLSAEHVSILSHTVGRAAGGLYCGDSPRMQELVAEGLMASAGRKAFVPDEYFGITAKGREALRQSVEASKCSREIPLQGWHWWLGVGNDRDTAGNRPSIQKWWCVLVWRFDGRTYASSGCWVEPLCMEEAGGRWGQELIPPA